MRDRLEPDLKGPDLHLLGHGAHGDHFIACKAVILHLEPRNMGGELARIDRRAQTAVKMTDSTDMVFMGMGDKDRVKLILARLDPFDIRKDKIDAGAGIHIRESHAHVDHDEALLVLMAVAIEVHVHANFARAAKREIDEPFCCHHFSFLLKL